MDKLAEANVNIHGRSLASRIFQTHFYSHFQFSGISFWWAARVVNSLPQVGPSRLRFVLSVAHKENSDLDLRRRPSTAEYLGLAPVRGRSGALQWGDGLAVAWCDHVLGGQGLLGGVGGVEASHVHVRQRHARSGGDWREGGASQVTV